MTEKREVECKPGAYKHLLFLQCVFRFSTSKVLHIVNNMAICTQIFESRNRWGNLQLESQDSTDWANSRKFHRFFPTFFYFMLFSSCILKVSLGHSGQIPMKIEIITDNRAYIPALVPLLTLCKWNYVKSRKLSAFYWNFNLKIISCMFTK